MLDDAIDMATALTCIHLLLQESVTNINLIGNIGFQEMSHES